MVDVTGGFRPSNKHAGSGRAPRQLEGPCGCRSDICADIAHGCFTPEYSKGTENRLKICRLSKCLRVRIPSPVPTSCPAGRHVDGIDASRTITGRHDDAP